MDRMRRPEDANEEVRHRLPLLSKTRSPEHGFGPRLAVWELTLRCNLSCQHCAARAGVARPSELDREECSRVVAELIALGVTEVSLMGGEAFLHPAFFDVVSDLARAKIRVSLATAGRGVTQELAERAVKAGIGSVSVAIDGLEGTHDWLRGAKGVWQSAFAAVQYFQQAGAWVGVNSQLNNKTCDELPSLLEVLVRHDVRFWQIALTVAMGRARDRPELLLQPYELLDVFPMLAQLKQRCDAEWIRFLPGNNLGYFGKYHELLRGPSAKSTRCGAGCASIAIEADGSVKGCPSLPTQPFAGGNLRVQRLVDIWRKAPALSATCDRNVEDLWGYCRSCQHADACLAGCTWTAFSLFGRAGNNPYCHHRARELRRRGLQERLVPLGDAPGHPFDYGTFDLILEKATGTDPANERLEV